MFSSPHCSPGYKLIVKQNHPSLLILEEPHIPPSGWWEQNFCQTS